MEYGFSKELYLSQKKVIADITNAIEGNKKIIISSPTGTGKTISLLCSVMKYMKKQTDEDSIYDLLSSKNLNKIYYCSRTHSQLSQALNELKSCSYSYNSVILGSRKMYCVNPDVIKYNNIDEMNDKCRELIQNDSCSYYKNKNFDQNTLDIEDLKAVARKKCFCPYYFAKSKASDCEIVFLPYNLLFTKEGRDSADIDLKDKILIIDEAHNIVDTVTELNSAEVTWDQIKQCSFAKNLDIDSLSVINRLLNYRTSIKSQKVLPVVDFLIESKLSGFNTLEISEKLTKGKVAQKNDLKCMFELIKLLKFMTFSDSSGRIFLDNFKIKFSSPDPKMYFKDLDQCKSVIFAGGTMEPVSQLKYIFPDILYNIYPSVNDNFISLIVTKAPSGKAINLSFSNRNEIIDDAVNTLVSLTTPVNSGGIVIFVPSIQILNMIKSSPKINFFRRKVTFEDSIQFKDFKESPEIIFAVMGGKLSEGINFNDDLCRLLIILGVPFPNKTAEIIERSKSFKDYEITVTMKTVNQAIGRAIRHKNDYAAIVFVDSRYLQLKNNLSAWILPKTKEIPVPNAVLEINQFLKKNLS